VSDLDGVGAAIERIARSVRVVLGTEPETWRKRRTRPDVSPRVRWASSWRAGRKRRGSRGAGFSLTGGVPGDRCRGVLRRGVPDANSAAPARAIQQQHSGTGGRVTKDVAMARMMQQFTGSARPGMPDDRPRAPAGPPRTGSLARRALMLFAKRKGHLGHVSDDGPPDAGGLRRWINSAALRFVPYEDLEAERYGQHKTLFDGSLGAEKPLRPFVSSCLH
jgi:hypothetical protein